MSAVATEIKDQVAKVEDPVEVLRPSVATRMQVVGKEDYRFTYEQKPLSFFGKLDFFAVMGRALDRAISGPDGISIADLVDVPDRKGAGRVSLEDLRDADMFVRGVTKLISYAPEIVGDLYCTILNVPQGQRPLIKEIMAMSADDGGLSDEDGVTILDTFVSQNWEVMRDFFAEQIAPLAKRVGERISQPSA